MTNLTPLFKPLVDAYRNAATEALRGVLKATKHPAVRRAVRMEADRREIRRIADRQRVIGRNYVDALFDDLYAELGLERDTTTHLTKEH